MKYLYTAALFFAAIASAFAQTPVTPTIVDGQVTITVPDSSGGTHVVTFPVTAVTALTAGAGTDTYTAPPTVTSIQASCSSASVATGASTQCGASAQGTGAYNAAVTWSASAGTVSATGLFTAPATAESVTVTATSAVDPTKSAKVAIVVTATAPVGPVAPVIPANAVAVDLVNSTTTWKNTKDAGTPGAATFSNNFPVSGIFAGDARAFAITYTGGGGVRFSNNFAKDTTSTNFVYDTIVQSPDWTHAANLELDINQVKANGKTSILGVQCSSYSKTWEVTQIAPQTSWHWVPTNVACNPLKWAPSAPHHIRIFGTMDAAGVSTYIGVELDGVYAPFTNATGSTAEALGWSTGSIVPNFQIDGLGTSGAVTIYAGKLTIYRW